MAALLLVAITFYACLALGDVSVPWGAQRAGALAVVLCLPFTFAAFLWWLTLGRLVLSGQVGGAVGWCVALGVPLQCYNGLMTRVDCGDSEGSLCILTTV